MSGKWISIERPPCGRAFAVNNLKDLPDVATKISMELRNQYVLGYRPSDHNRDGKWRKIKIKLRPPKGLPPLSVRPARYLRGASFLRPGVVLRLSQPVITEDFRTAANSLGVR